MPDMPQMGRYVGALCCGSPRVVETRSNRKRAFHRCAAAEVPLLLDRGLQVAQHTDLAEQDGSGVVAVERAHLPVLKTEDIAGRGVELLTRSGDRSQGCGKVTFVG